MIAGGDRDAAYSVETFRRTAAGVPGGKLIVRPGVTHLGAIRDAQLVADLLDFLDGETG